MDAKRKELLRIRRDAELGRGTNAFQALGLLDLLSAAEAERDRFLGLLARAYDIATSRMPDQDVPGEIAALLVEEVGDGR